MGSWRYRVQFDGRTVGTKTANTSSQTPTARWVPTFGLPLRWPPKACSTRFHLIQDGAVVRGGQFDGKGANTVIRKITVENFQSHARTEIKLNPVPGLTALVGESDAGKSAVVRALRWLFLNEPRGAEFVRQGQRECCVAVEYADGTVVKRARYGDENEYRVTGYPPFRGFGTEPPLEVTRATGVRKVEIGSESVCPNIAGQLDPPFALGLPGPARAAFVGFLARADAFDAALRGALTDADRTGREARRLADEVARLDAEIGRFADLPVLEAVAEEASRILAEAEDLAGKRELLTRLAEEARDLRTGIAAAGQVLEATVAATEAEAALSEAETLCGKASNLRNLLAQRRVAAEEQERATRLLSATTGVPEAEKEVSEAERAGRALAHLRDAARAKEQVLAERDRAASLAEAVTGAGEAEALLAECVKESEKAAKLKEASTELHRWRREAQLQTQEARRAAEFLSKAKREMKDVLKRLGRCPVCFSEISEEVAESAVENIFTE